MTGAKRFVNKFAAEYEAQSRHRYHFYMDYSNNNEADRRW